MAQNVIINGVTYQNVPEVDIPKSGGGTAKFYDTASGTAAAADILTGKSAFNASGSVSGSMANNGSTSGTISTKAGTVTSRKATPPAARSPSLRLRSRTAWPGTSWPGRTSSECPVGLLSRRSVRTEPRRS